MSCTFFTATIHLSDLWWIFIQYGEVLNVCTNEGTCTPIVLCLIYDEKGPSFGRYIFQKRPFTLPLGLMASKVDKWALHCCIGYNSVMPLPQKRAINGKYSVQYCAFWNCRTGAFSPSLSAGGRGDGGGFLSFPHRWQRIQPGDAGLWGPISLMATERESWVG